MRYVAAAVILSVSAAAAILVSPPRAVADPVTVTATVLKVVDGDTIDIRDDVRGRLRVRILGIDTPETKKPGYTAGCWGPEATEFAKSSMIGQRVALVPDPTQDQTDRYGRTLAYLVRADVWDYSVEAARAGAAHSYVYGGVPVSRYNAIEAAETEARNAGRGLWVRRATALRRRCRSEPPRALMRAVALCRASGRGQVRLHANAGQMAKPPVFRRAE